MKSLGLTPSILKILEKKGYSSPTEIQQQSIPSLLDGRDLIGIAQTGTGKTASFLLPIVQRLFENKRKAKPARMRALVLTPTRELASQIEESFSAYSKGLALSSTVIFGGVKPKEQIRQMQNGQQLLVATPGRLLDLMGEGHILFDQLEFFVLDEADRMLDMGFIHDIKKILKKLPKKKQTALFSATMSKEIEEIAKSLLQNPVKVEVTPEATTVEKISQKVVDVEKRKKPKLLLHVLKSQKVKSALVFSRTKHGCDRIVKRLKSKNITAAAIHGNKSQGARETALREFKSQKVQILVATDIAARGIDIPHVGHVFNYDIPRDPSSYVHRIGRTARAGRDGVAISFCDSEEVSLLKSVEKLIKYKIPHDESLEKVVSEIKIDTPVANSRPPQKKDPKVSRRNTNRDKGNKKSARRRKTKKTS